MKRLFAFVLCLVTLLVMTIAPLTCASAERSYQFVNSYKNGRPVNLRSQPNTNSEVVVKLEHRATVLVYEYNKQRTWAYVETDNPNGGSLTVKGWISTEFLSKRDPGNWKPSPKPTEDPAAEVIANLSAVAAKIKPVAEPYSAEITTKNPTALVHLRWFPNTSAKFVDAFPRGTAVTVIAKGGKWTQVVYTPDGTNEMHVGFVLSDNVLEY